MGIQTNCSGQAHDAATMITIGTSTVITSPPA
jgi:hypothetical protein